MELAAEQGYAGLSTMDPDELGAWFRRGWEVDGWADSGLAGEYDVVVT